jgi:AmmeMemoRadiSam system protein B
MDSLRRTAVAGRWYSDDARQLAADVDRYLADAGIETLPRPPLALIAPHAGLMYSGPVAAFAYGAARATPFRTIVLVGPSHFIPFRGVSVWPEGRWQTPFGDVAIDAALASSIRAESPEIVELADAHGREHSLEMQLPFVARLFPGAAIVPLVMGHQTWQTAFALGDAIARALTKPGQAARGGHVPEGVLLVASSDLSHYENAHVAAAMDDVVVRHVEDLDPGSLMTALEREPRHACGGGPMVAVLHAAKQLGATTARALRYADSGDVSGDKSSVVGYLAAAVW